MTRSATRMTPTRAAAVWLFTERVIAGVRHAHDEAEKVLKEHFAAKKLTRFRGVTYTETTQHRLNADLARAALGPKKTKACTKPVTLKHLAPATDAEPMVPAELAKL